jgi:hypothetical protein
MVLNCYDLLESNSAYKLNNGCNYYSDRFVSQRIVIFVGVRKLIAVTQ